MYRLSSRRRVIAFSELSPPLIYSFKVFLMLAEVGICGFSSHGQVFGDLNFDAGADVWALAM